jgi:Restriction endonuclease fold toxin 5
MPIVRLYPESESLPLRIPDAARNVPAARDIDLFGGNRARDLQVAGQQLGQASDSLFALYDRHAQQANDTRVQDFNNQFITGMQQILRTGPEAYFNQKGADAIRGAGAATERLAALKKQLFEGASNDYQRRKLAPILDAHFASGSEQIARHLDQQQQVYERNVHLASIEVAEQEAISNPGNLAAAVTRAADATRALYKGQVPEVIESEAGKAGSRVVSNLIKDRLGRNDRLAVGLYRQYEKRLDPNDRTALGKAVETLSNQVDAAAWIRDRSASLPTSQGRAPVPTGDATLDAVNAASATLPEPPPVTSAAGTLLHEEGVAGYRQRLDGIEDRRRALTALNEQEFAAHPARLRANRTAIEADSAQGRAAVNADANELYAELRRHLTAGGPNGGPAVTLPPAMIMSGLTEPQQDAVTAQVHAAIEGRKPSTDPQTWYAIRQGLTGNDASERQRWGSKNLVPFMGRLSEQDFVGLEKLQALVRDDGDGAEQRRLQDIGRLANRALRSAGIDPTPQPDDAPDSDAAQAARFHRTLQDELSAFESQGRTPTAAEAYDIVDGVKQTAIKSGWLEVSDDSASPTLASDIPSVDDALHEPGPELAQAEPPEQPAQHGFRIVGLAPDFETFHSQMEEERQREAAERSAAGPGGAPGAPSIEPYPGSTEYETADAQARDIAAEQTTEEESAGNGAAPSTEPPPGSPEYHTAEKEARRVADRQEANGREADRRITRWLAERRDDGAPPKLAPTLAKRLSPAEREELEALAATPDTPTDPEEYNKILRNLLNYNSQVRLKWAREPLFRYRKSLSSEDFAKLARIQSRLDPDTGQVSGFAPVPADLVPVYDRLAPDPDWHYGTIIPLKRTPDGKDWDFAMPSSARTFLKGILDLLAGVKTGELTPDAVESFMTLHGIGGRAFGPLGDAGTLVAGGKRRTPASSPSNAKKDVTPAASTGIRIARSKGAAKSGPGVWRTVNHGMSPRSAAYQAKITGRPATEGYFVEGVEFDGYRAGKLLEAKGEGYATWVKNGEFLPIFEGRRQLLDQMQRQERVANGMPIIWHVAEPAAVDAVRALMKEAMVKGLTIVHTP